MLYDVIIIGSGPAGFSAAIYAARREMKTLVIGREIGGQMVWASEIENYLGFVSINSFELIKKMEEHVRANNVEIKSGEIKKIERQKNGNFILQTDKEKFETKTVIVAIGLAPRRLAIPGEEELQGRGVTYCATCDGPFYRGKTVAVAGGGNSALDAAEMLSKIAAKVYLVHRRQEFRGFEALAEEVKKKKNIEIILDSEIKEIIGEEKVREIKVLNNKTGEEKEILVDGVFVEIGRVAHTDIVKDFVERTQNGQIIVDEYCRTKTAGLFAAGDATNSPFKQISIAAGQGTIAALAAYQYLQMKRGESVDVIFDRGKRG